jgi:transcriptional regulator
VGLIGTSRAVFYETLVTLRDHSTGMDLPDKARPLDTEREWRDLVADHPFGHLIASGKDRALPVVAPTHIQFDGERTIRLHLARPNPVWPALRENPRCLFVVTAAVAYVPTSWEAPPGTPSE